MNKLKVIWGNWLKKIKKWEIVKMLNYKEEINRLNNELERTKQEIRDLTDLSNIYKRDRNRLERQLEKTKIRIVAQEGIVDASDRTIKKQLEKIKELDETNDELLNKAFNLELENKSKQVMIDNYEAQIKDLKSNRYLIRKLPAGKARNTIKTKISRPMSARVTKYMRGEHE